MERASIMEKSKIEKEPRQTTIKFSKNLLASVEKFLEENQDLGYLNKAEYIRMAVRNQLLADIKEKKLKKP